jgi:hypothetical protein
MLNKALDFARVYAKALVAAGGLLVMVGDALATGHFNSGKAFDLATALVTALAVHRVKNKPKATS